MRIDEEWRHQCEVRQVLMWRATMGGLWVRKWLSAVAAARGKPSANRLGSDAREQWSRGNRGLAADWRSGV
jgi:hypothetical protein